MLKEHHREHLEKLRYQGPARMDEFCTEFQRLEMQISDKELTLEGRLLKSMPHDVRTWTNLCNPPTSMDVVYQTARKCARSYNQGQPQRIERIRIREHRDPVATSRNPAPLEIMAPPAPAESPGENLDMLNRMGAANSKCYSCGRYGHFASQQA